MNTKPLPEVLEIIKSHGWGSLKDDRIVPLHREEEPMKDLSAQEFSDEAKLHPERYEHIAQMIKKLADESGVKNPVIVDFGCGPGVLTSMIAKIIPNATVIGIDLSEDMLKIARKNAEEQNLNIDFFQHDSHKIFSLEGKDVDILVSRNMLHRLASLEAGLTAMANTVKKQGGIVLNVSFRNLNDLDAEAQKHFVPEFQIRSDFPRLQEAWVFALLNAPTLSQYQTAAKKASEATELKSVKVSTDHFHEVYVTLKND
jgi:2-polyprenyl-3-methyl-5-hydroxy-6-metoxy-1,4-benzoquinol methylase